VDTFGGITMEYYIIKTSKHDIENRKFFVDQYDSVFESLKTCNVFFCKLNGRSLKKAILQAIEAKGE
jgi:hypothetical protein